jgi:peroxiredoxin
MPDSVKTVYAQQYYFAKENLEGISRYWLMAQLLATAFRKEAPEKALAIYKDFILSNPYMELDRIAGDAFQRSKQFAAGSPAPTFSLQDAAGNWLSLRDLQGKLVYLDFWASWCRPCMSKMQAMKNIYPLFEGKNIVFLHVNLDKSPEIWKNILKEQGFGGIQLYNSPDANITQDYEVMAVPKFFVISKEGNFAFAPAGSLEKLAETLLKLLK